MGVICSRCGKYPAAGIIGLCTSCVRESPDIDIAAIHKSSRHKYGLPLSPPRAKAGKRCFLCSNRCSLVPGDTGYCGMRINREGKTGPVTREGYALAHFYKDPLPTNCCASWFCEASGEQGNNLAVFFYGCNLDCLFCQNHSHKNLEFAEMVSMDELLKAAMARDIRCICFFGGSPEPQLPFALQLAERICHESDKKKRICWEWNGCGNLSSVKKAAELSILSGGIVKFDLKAFHLNIGRVLCGVDISMSFSNFSRVAQLNRDKNYLTATTLLVPYYIDEKEVGQIAGFIAGLDPNIPYSLLVYHPRNFLKDLPITPGIQVEKCYSAACQRLNRINIGNKHLL